MPGANPPRVPEGLRDMMKSLTKEVLREKPSDILEFSAQYFETMLHDGRDSPVRSYEPAESYETIMKNRVKHQVPLSLVYSVVPETLTELIKEFIKAVLRQNPKNICEFAVEYFRQQQMKKEMQTATTTTVDYSSYENYFQKKERYSYTSFVKCTCGRLLGNTAYESNYLNIKKTKLRQGTKSEKSTANDNSSLCKIEHEQPEGKSEKKVADEKMEKEKGIKYIKAVYVIQHHFRLYLARKRKVKEILSEKETSSSLLTETKQSKGHERMSMETAALVLQKAYRKFLKNNRLRNKNSYQDKETKVSHEVSPQANSMSMETAALIIQKAFHKFSNKRLHNTNNKLSKTTKMSKLETSTTEGEGDESNDNMSETASYTSASTALLSTESVGEHFDLSGTNEEGVLHQTIQEDEEVENDNQNNMSLSKMNKVETINNDKGMKTSERKGKGTTKEKEIKLQSSEKEKSVGLNETEGKNSEISSIVKASLPIIIDGLEMETSHKAGNGDSSSLNEKNILLKSTDEATKVQLAETDSGNSENLSKNIKGSHEAKEPTEGTHANDIKSDSAVQETPSDLQKVRDEIETKSVIKYEEGYKETMNNSQDNNVETSKTSSIKESNKEDHEKTSQASIKDKSIDLDDSSKSETLQKTKKEAGDTKVRQNSSKEEVSVHPISSSENLLNSEKLVEESNPQQESVDHLKSASKDKSGETSKDAPEKDIVATVLRDSEISPRSPMLLDNQNEESSNATERKSLDNTEDISESNNMKNLSEEEMIHGFALTELIGNDQNLKEVTQNFLDFEQKQATFKPNSLSKQDTVTSETEKHNTNFQTPGHIIKATSNIIEATSNIIEATSSSFINDESQEATKSDPEIVDAQKLETIDNQIISEPMKSETKATDYKENEGNNHLENTGSFDQNLTEPKIETASESSENLQASDIKLEDDNSKSTNVLKESKKLNTGTDSKENAERKNSEEELIQEVKKESPSGSSETVQSSEDKFELQNPSTAPSEECASEQLLKRERREVNETKMDASDSVDKSGSIENSKNDDSEVKVASSDEGKPSPLGEKGNESETKMTSDDKGSLEAMKSENDDSKLTNESDIKDVTGGTTSSNNNDNDDSTVKSSAEVKSTEVSTEQETTEKSKSDRRSSIEESHNASDLKEENSSSQEEATNAGATNVTKTEDLNRATSSNKNSIDNPRIEISSHDADSNESTLKEDNVEETNLSGSNVKEGDKKETSISSEPSIGDFENGKSSNEQSNIQSKLSELKKVISQEGTADLISDEKPEKVSLRIASSDGTLDEPTTEMPTPSKSIVDEAEKLITTKNNENEPESRHHKLSLNKRDTDNELNRALGDSKPSNESLRESLLLNSRENSKDETSAQELTQETSTNKSTPQRNMSAKSSQKLNTVQSNEDLKNSVESTPKSTSKEGNQKVEALEGEVSQSDDKKKRSSDTINQADKDLQHTESDKEQSALKSSERADKSEDKASLKDKPSQDSVDNVLNEQNLGTSSDKSDNREPSSVQNDKSQSDNKAKELVTVDNLEEINKNSASKEPTETVAIEESVNRLLQKSGSSNPPIEIVENTKLNAKEKGKSLEENKENDEEISAPTSAILKTLMEPLLPSENTNENPRLDKETRESKNSEELEVDSSIVRQSKDNKNEASEELSKLIHSRESNEISRPVKSASIEETGEKLEKSNSIELEIKSDSAKEDDSEKSESGEHKVSTKSISVDDKNFRELEVSVVPKSTSMKRTKSSSLEKHDSDKSGSGEKKLSPKSNFADLKNMSSNADNSRKHESSEHEVSVVPKSTSVEKTKSSSLEKHDSDKLGSGEKKLSPKSNSADLKNMSSNADNSRKHESSEHEVSAVPKSTFMERTKSSSLEKHDSDKSGSGGHEVAPKSNSAELEHLSSNVDNSKNSAVTPKSISIEKTSKQSEKSGSEEHEDVTKANTTNDKDAAINDDSQKSECSEHKVSEVAPKLTSVERTESTSSTKENYEKPKSEESVVAEKSDVVGSVERTEVMKSKEDDSESEKPEVGTKVTSIKKSEAMKSKQENSLDSASGEPEVSIDAFKSKSMDRPEEVKSKEDNSQISESVEHEDLTDAPAKQSIERKEDTASKEDNNQESEAKEHEVKARSIEDIKSKGDNSQISETGDQEVPTVAQKSNSVDKTDSTESHKNRPGKGIKDKNTKGSKHKVDDLSSSQIDDKKTIGTSKLSESSHKNKLTHASLLPNSKKLHSSNQKDKKVDYTSGRMISVPIAELQLKSFKTPADAGPWYEVHVEKPSEEEKTSNIKREAYQNMENINHAQQATEEERSLHMSNEESQTSEDSIFGDESSDNRSETSSYESNQSTLDLLYAINLNHELRYSAEISHLEQLVGLMQVAQHEASYLKDPLDYPEYPAEEELNPTNVQGLQSQASPPPASNKSSISFFVPFDNPDENQGQSAKAKKQTKQNLQKLDIKGTNKPIQPRISKDLLSQSMIDDSLDEIMEMDEIIITETIPSKSLLQTIPEQNENESPSPQVSLDNRSLLELNEPEGSKDIVNDSSTEAKALDKSKEDESSSQDLPAESKLSTENIQETKADETENGKLKEFESTGKSVVENEEDLKIDAEPEKETQDVPTIPTETTLLVSEPENIQPTGHNLIRQPRSVDIISDRSDQNDEVKETDEKSNGIYEKVQHGITKIVQNFNSALKGADKSKHSEEDTESETNLQGQLSGDQGNITKDDEEELKKERKHQEKIFSRNTSEDPNIDDEGHSKDSDAISSKDISERNSKRELSKSISSESLMKESRNVKPQEEVSEEIVGKEEKDTHETMTTSVINEQNLNSTLPGSEIKSELSIEERVIEEPGDLKEIHQTQSLNKMDEKGDQSEELSKDTNEETLMHEKELHEIDSSDIKKKYLPEGVLEATNSKTSVDEKENVDPANLGELSEMQSSNKINEDSKDFKEDDKEGDELPRNLNSQGNQRVTNSETSRDAADTVNRADSEVSGKDDKLQEVESLEEVISELIEENSEPTSSNGTNSKRSIEEMKTVEPTDLKLTRISRSASEKDTKSVANEESEEADVLSNEALADDSSDFYNQNLKGTTSHSKPSMDQAETINGPEENLNDSNESRTSKEFSEKDMKMHEDFHDDATSESMEENSEAISLNEINSKLSLEEIDNMESTRTPRSVNEMVKKTVKSEDLDGVVNKNDETLEKEPSQPDNSDLNKQYLKAILAHPEPPMDRAKTLEENRDVENEDEENMTINEKDEEPQNAEKETKIIQRAETLGIQDLQSVEIVDDSKESKVDGTKDIKMSGAEPQEISVPDFISEDSIKETDNVKPTEESSLLQIENKIDGLEDESKQFKEDVDKDAVHKEDHLEITTSESLDSNEKADLLGTGESKFSKEETENSSLSNFKDTSEAKSMNDQEKNNEGFKETVEDDKVSEKESKGNAKLDSIESNLNSELLETIKSELSLEEPRNNQSIDLEETREPQSFDVISEKDKEIEEIKKVDSIKEIESKEIHSDDLEEENVEAETLKSRNSKSSLDKTASVKSVDSADIRDSELEDKKEETNIDNEIDTADKESDKTLASELKSIHSESLNEQTESMELTNELKEKIENENVALSIEDENGFLEENPVEATTSQRDKENIKSVPLSATNSKSSKEELDNTNLSGKKATHSTKSVEKSDENELLKEEPLERSNPELNKGSKRQSSEEQQKDNSGTETENIENEAVKELSEKTKDSHSYESQEENDLNETELKGKLVDMFDMAKYVKAAIVIQRAFRKFLKDKIKIENSKKLKEIAENHAALVIQKAFRQYLYNLSHKKQSGETYLENVSLDLDAMENSKEFNDKSESSSMATSPSVSQITQIYKVNRSGSQNSTDTIENISNMDSMDGSDGKADSPKSKWFVGNEPIEGISDAPKLIAVDSQSLSNFDATSSDSENLLVIADTEPQLVVACLDNVDDSKLKSNLSIGNNIIGDENGESVEGTNENSKNNDLAGLEEDENEIAETGSKEDNNLMNPFDEPEFETKIDEADKTFDEIVNEEMLVEVIEKPCIKKTVSRSNLNEIESEESEPKKARKSAESSESETDVVLKTIETDSLDAATEKLSKADEVLEKMFTRRLSETKLTPSLSEVSFKEPSFDEPVIRPMSALHESLSIDLEETDIVVVNRLLREDTRESSAQSDAVVFGESNLETDDLDALENIEVSSTKLQRLYTIAGDDTSIIFKSVTIDETVKYIDPPNNSSTSATSGSSFCLDEDISENIRQKMMAYSLSEADSDYFEASHDGADTSIDRSAVRNDDFNISTALADTAGTSTETESTIVSAATKIQAGARGFLTRRRLRRLSGGTTTSLQETKASFGNEAISESLERFIEDEAAKKIQMAYRNHYYKKGKANNNGEDDDDDHEEGASLDNSLAARRLTLQRGDALRNDSTPDEDHNDNGTITKSSNSSSTTRSKPLGDYRLKPWAAMRQNSMPVQIDTNIFRVIPQHLSKRIKSAENEKKPRRITSYRRK